MVNNPSAEALKGYLLFSIPFVSNDNFFYNMIMGCVDAANSNNANYKILNYASPAERLDIIRESTLSDYSAVVLAAYENEYDHALKARIIL